MSAKITQKTDCEKEVNDSKSWNMAILKANRSISKLRVQLQIIDIYMQRL